MSNKRNECLRSKLDDVGEFSSSMKRHLAYNQFHVLVVLGYPNSKEGVEPNPKLVGKITIKYETIRVSFGLTNFCRRMIPDFAIKMLPSNAI